MIFIMPSQFAADVSHGVRAWRLLAVAAGLVSSAAGVKPQFLQDGNVQHLDGPTSMVQLQAEVQAWLDQERTTPHSSPQMTEMYLNRNVEYALRARTEIPAVATVPDDQFLANVLPYRVVDEPIDDWRPQFFEALRPYAAQAKTLREVVDAVVPRAFTSLGNTVVFQGNCTPQVMAPVSETLKVGHASCTGCSILLVDALRSVGVPSRIVGTPEWNIETGGNHNWVEVWTGEGSSDGWHFFDAAPTEAVTWDRGWFVPTNTGAAVSGGIHGIYAPIWNSKNADSNYTITWREPFAELPATDRTHVYKSMTSACSDCPYTGLP